MRKTACLLTACLLALNIVNAQVTDEPYKYPVRPGTEEWKSFKKHKDLREISQIPETLIQRMDTKTLLQSVIDYPLIGDVLIFKSYKAGINQLKSNFFAIDSLIRRTDFLAHLIDQYKSYEVTRIGNLKSVVEVGEYILGLSMLEMLMTTEDVLKNINDTQRNLLVSELLTKYEEKHSRVNIYGNVGLSTCMWALASFIKESETLTTMNSGFLKEGYTLSINELNRNKEQIFSNLKNK